MPQNFVEKTFVDGYQTLKFAEVFSLESFPLYSIYYCPMDRQRACGLLFGFILWGCSLHPTPPPPELASQALNMRLPPPPQDLYPPRTSRHLPTLEKNLEINPVLGCLQTLEYHENEDDTMDVSIAL